MRSNVFHIILILLFPLLLVGQSVNTTFGKNRVQYHDDFNKWDKYETENFISYWYGKSRNIGQSVAQMAELDHDEIQRILEHRLNKKIEIVVYVDLSDVKQTNLGNEDSYHSKDNITRVVGNKMFVYFDGDHRHLRKQIRKGLATVYINSILFGSNLQEQVQNAILLRLPEWFKQGLVSFAGSNWDYQIEDKLKDVIQSKPKRYLDFDKLVDDYPEVAGHSMWYYLEQMYGMANIANLVYLTRINRKLDESFYYILGVPFEQIKEDWSKFYQAGFDVQMMEEKDVPENIIEIKNRRNLPYSNIKINHKGDQMIYVLNDNGKFFVNLYNFDSGESTRILKFGTKNIFQETDFNYPLVAWHPSDRYISLVYEHKDLIYLKEIDVFDGEEKGTTFPSNYQRLYGIDYIDGENYMINASVDGYSDLFTFNIKSRSTKRLTEDFYDDLDAKVIKYKGQNGILFSSNRNELLIKNEKLDTILPLGEMDLFFYPFNDDKEKTLTRISKTDNISERNAFVASENKYVYLSYESGRNQRYILDENESGLNSAYERNILLHDYSPSGKYLYTQKINNKNYLLSDELRLDFKGEESESKITKAANNATPLVIVNEKEEILPGYLFQSEFDDPSNLQEINQKDPNDPTLKSGFDKYFSNYFSESVQDGKRVIKFSPMRANAARLTFRWFDITTKVDNSVLFEGLESYTENAQDLQGQPMGILFKTDVKDIFEDYKIQAGLRLPTGFNGSEIFVVADDDKKLFDHRYALYRKSVTDIDQADFLPITRFRKNSMLGLYRIKYPFDVYRSLNLTTSLRIDRFFFLSSDINSLNANQDREKRLAMKLEYIFDNSFNVGLNIKNGARYKVFMEAINSFDFQVTDGFDFTLSNGFTSIFGFDARYYQPILKHAVLAFRGTGATSFGSDKMLYFLGGVESALGGKYNENIPVPGGNYTYKALAPHLRGFDYNIRNGNSYLLSNVELRLPLLSLMGIKRIKYSFLRDLQLVGFFDAGLAWHGKSPFDANNPINNTTLESPPVIIVNIKYFRDPLVMGYGFGLRSTLLRYFVKLDYAWGIETSAVQKPKLYLSLGKDF